MNLHKLLPNLGNHILFYPGLAKVLGSKKASILLSKFLEWQETIAELNDGWIVKTQEEIEEATTLSKLEQATARKILRDKGYLIETKLKVTDPNYYMLNLEKLRNDLNNFNQEYKNGR